MRRAGKDDMSDMGAWPLVGRSAELRVITEAVARPGVGGVVIVGAAGLGRTRLAREALARLGAQGHPTAWATGSRSASALPLGALLPLTVQPPPAVRPSPEVHAAVAPPSPAGPLFAQLVERFNPPTGRRPVLAVDDAHLLDSASAALVHQLALHTRAFVILTVRQGPPPPDVVTALWKEDLALRLDLRPLGDGETDLLLEGGLSGPVDVVTRRTLRYLAAGRPLVLRELVQAGLDQGGLRRDDGPWHLRGRVRVTARLGDLIEAQMQVDDPGVQEVLEVLAYAEPLGQPALERLTGVAAVVNAERQGLVVVEQSGARRLIRLAVPAYGEVVRARMPRARARAIWGRLAERLAVSPRRRADDPLDLARWRLRAGLGVTAQELLAAARRATERLELREAEELALAARAAGGGVEADLTVAEILAAQGRHAAAAAALPRPEACAGRGGFAQASRRAMLHERITYWGPLSVAGSGGERAWTSGPDGDAGGERAAEAVRAWTSLLDGHVDRALALGGGLLTKPDPELPAQATLWAATAVAFAAGLNGALPLVEHASRIGLGTAHTHRRTRPWAQAQVAGTRCLALLLGGALTPAAEAAEDGYREAAATEAAPVVGLWAAVRGVVAKAQGRVRPAQQALREAVVLLDRHDPFRLRRLYLAELAGAHAMAGDTVQADRWLSRMADAPEPPGTLLSGWIQRDRAWVLAAALDLPGAVAVALEAAQAARDAGAPLLEAQALADAARFGAAKQVSGRLGELAGETGNQAVVAFAAWCAALAEDDAEALTELAGTLRALGHLLPAAEAAATAHRLHVAAGRRAAAKRTLVLARELQDECDGARTPLTDLTTSEASLTPRELQVARLIASGLSGRAVAARLGLSLRTVNNHLGRVYAKLGVSGRNALERVLGGYDAG
ncbi:helix-turn-helix transcriptional regulator [Nonomuraea sp. NPDC050310]|uniref:helix-turn-helix transcriptional regulator n=1 Tax=Nonomuraea sp. NPDC050310 TaxID=3154935 RepID=UPI0033D26577